MSEPLMYRPRYRWEVEGFTPDQVDDPWEIVETFTPAHSGRPTWWRGFVAEKHWSALDGYDPTHRSVL